MLSLTRNYRSPIGATAHQIIAVWKPLATVNCNFVGYSAIRTNVTSCVKNFIQLAELHDSYRFRQAIEHVAQQLPLKSADRVCDSCILKPVEFDKWIQL